MADAKDKRIAELEARIDGLVNALVKAVGHQVYPVVVPIGPVAPCMRPHADAPLPYYPRYPYTGTFPAPVVTWGSTTSGTNEPNYTVTVN